MNLLPGSSLHRQQFLLYFLSISYSSLQFSITLPEENHPVITSPTRSVNRALSIGRRVAFKTPQRTTHEDYTEISSAASSTRQEGGGKTHSNITKSIMQGRPMPVTSCMPSLTVQPIQLTEPSLWGCPTHLSIMSRLSAQLQCTDGKTFSAGL